MKTKSLILIGCLVLASSAFAADGAAVYKSKCQMCHGPNGDASSGMAKSMGLKPLNSAEVQKMSAADLTALVDNGKGKMPGFKGKISDDDVKAVVDYVKSLK